MASRQALTLVSPAMKPRAHCINSQNLMCFNSRNIRQKEKPWPENTDFGELTAPWYQLSLFPARQLRNLWFQEKQLAYSKTQNGVFCKYCALLLPISLPLTVQPLQISSGQEERYCQELSHQWKCQCCYQIQRIWKAFLIQCLVSNLKFPCN